MKNIINIKGLYFIFFAFVLLLSGCKKDKFQNYSSFINKYPQFSDVLPVDIFSVEKDSEFVLKFTLKDAPIVDLIVPITVTSGTATEGEDFDLVTTSLTVPAFSKEGSIVIQLYKDDIIEGDENFYIHIGDSSTANIKPYTINFHLSDYIGPNLDITFDWNKIIDIADVGQVPTGPNFDIDIYVLDENGDDTGNYDAATGSSPEKLSFTTPDDTGTYYLYANLWDNVFTANGIFLDDLVPITMDFHRDGKLGSFQKTQPDSVAFNLSTLDTANDGGDSFVALCKLVVTADGFMVYDTDDTSLVNARKKRFTPNPNKVKSHIPLKISR